MAGKMIPQTRYAHCVFEGLAGVLNDEGQAPATGGKRRAQQKLNAALADLANIRSEEHTSELQSLMRISYAVFCLKKKTQIRQIRTANHEYITYIQSTINTNN